MMLVLPHSACHDFPRPLSLLPQHYALTDTASQVQVKAMGMGPHGFVRTGSLLQRTVILHLELAPKVLRGEPKLLPLPQ